MMNAPPTGEMSPINPGHYDDLTEDSELYESTDDLDCYDELSSDSDLDEDIVSDEESAQSGSDVSTWQHTSRSTSHTLRQSDTETVQAIPVTKTSPSGSIQSLLETISSALEMEAHPREPRPSLCKANCNPLESQPVYLDQTHEHLHTERKPWKPRIKFPLPLFPTPYPPPRFLEVTRFSPPIWRRHPAAHVVPCHQPATMDELAMQLANLQLSPPADDWDRQLEVCDWKTPMEEMTVDLRGTSSRWTKPRAYQIPVIRPFIVPETSGSCPPAFRALPGKPFQTLVHPGEPALARWIRPPTPTTPPFGLAEVPDELCSPTVSPSIWSTPRSDTSTLVPSDDEVLSPPKGQHLKPGWLEEEAPSSLLLDMHPPKRRVYPPFARLSAGEILSRMYPHDQLSATVTAPCREPCADLPAPLPRRAAVQPSLLPPRTPPPSISSSADIVCDVASIPQLNLPFTENPKVARSQRVKVAELQRVWS